MKTLLIIAFVLALVGSPTARALAGDAVRGLISMATPNAEASEADQHSFDRICPLFEVYTDLDTEGKKTTGKAIRRLSAKAAEQTDDPAVRVFLATIPLAVGTGSNAQSKAARALVGRECAAHGW